MADDDLVEAQWLTAHTTGAYSQQAIALALIDIAHTLRDIRDELHDFGTYGAPVKIKTG